jgi:hypothetical protein
MPAPLNVPIGERVSLGIGKETVFGTAVAPTVFHPVMDFSPTSKNVAIPRTSSRGQLSQVYPATGTYEGKISLSVESCPDTLPQLLAYSLGSQSAPTHSVVNTTTTANTLINATTVPVASAVNIVPGMVITVGACTPIAVASVSGLTVTVVGPGLSAATTLGATVTCTSATAYASRLKLGTPLATFTCQNNRVTDALAYSGCKVDTFSLTLDPKKGLDNKFTLVNQTEAIVGSPASPTFSALYPFLFQTVGGMTAFNGTAIGIAGSAAVLGWDIQGANTIKTDYYSAANGRFAMSFPEQMRKISGKLTLGFENDVAQQAFWGGSSSPGTVVPSASIVLSCVSTDIADATLAIPYMITFTLGKCFIESADVAQKPGSILQQVVTFQAAQTAAGNNDDLVVDYVNTAATIY